MKDLRHKKAHLIDEESMYQVRQGKVSYKYYSSTNSVNTYNDGQNICFSDLSKNVFEGDPYLNVKSEKFQLMIDPQGVLSGAEAVALHGSSLYKIRRPIQYGNLAISQNYTKTEIIQDLSLILTQALEKFIKMEPHNFKHFSVILVIPSTIPKHHLRYLIEMVAQLGFK